MRALIHIEPAPCGFVKVAAADEPQRRGEPSPASAVNRSILITTSEAWALGRGCIALSTRDFEGYMAAKPWANGGWDDPVDAAKFGVILRAMKAEKERIDAEANGEPVDWDDTRRVAALHVSFPNVDGETLDGYLPLTEDALKRLGARFLAAAWAAGQMADADGLLSSGWEATVNALADNDFNDDEPCDCTCEDSSDPCDECAN